MKDAIQGQILSRVHLVGIQSFPSRLVGFYDISTLKVI